MYRLKRPVEFYPQPDPYVEEFRYWRRGIFLTVLQLHRVSCCVSWHMFEHTWCIWLLPSLSLILSYHHVLTRCPLFYRPTIYRPSLKYNNVFPTIIHHSITTAVLYRLPSWQLKRSRSQVLRLSWLSRLKISLSQRNYGEPWDQYSSVSLGSRAECDCYGLFMLDYTVLIVVMTGFRYWVVAFLRLTLQCTLMYETVGFAV